MTVSLEAPVSPPLYGAVAVLFRCTGLDLFLPLRSRPEPGARGRWPSPRTVSGMRCTDGFDLAFRCQAPYDSWVG